MDQASLNRLEQLARLKEAGALTDEEFAIAKTTVLEHKVTANRASTTPRAEVSTSAKAAETLSLSATWRFRFDFLDTHGLPGTPSYQAAFRALSLWNKIRVRSSFWGLVFGPFYLLYLGLWRAALTVTAGLIAVVVLLALLGASDDALQPLGAGFGGLIASTCVPLYYLKVVCKKNRWNPIVWRTA
ncbi:DUF2628 domain-containing protein [Sphingomonas sp.]|uniref:DUF2628 domain-containing protein n=1 Tax=Sphingomonas sp. TaxID=28214 RepID=UPI003B00EA22